MLEKLNLPTTNDFAAIQQLQVLAYTHPLTNLFNRLAFQKICDEIVSDSVIIIFDVDNLKNLNTVLGHFEADKILKAVGAVIDSKLKRSKDFCFHFGGDEFAAILSDCSLPYAIGVAEEICLMVNFVDCSLPVSVSVGLAVVDNRGVSECLANADRAMYRAKFQGKNRVFVHRD